MVTAGWSGPDRGARALASVGDSEELFAALDGLSDEELARTIDSLPEAVVGAILQGMPQSRSQRESGPLDTAEVLYEGFVRRPHLDAAAGVILDAVRRVEAGESQRIIVQMPPRYGKTTLTTLITPSWLLSRHPDWPIALVSHDGSLAASWGRQLRRWAEAGRLGPDVQLAKDAGAVGHWETTKGGTVMSLSIRESFTGRGARCLVIDDPLKDYAEAHSRTARDYIWNWWLSVAQLRLEPPSLTIVVLTRWHEDDLAGRLLDREHEGDPDDWQVLKFPAVSLGPTVDALGREAGEPLLSPLLPDETPDQASKRLGDLRASVGSYVWSAMFQQSPSPATGSIFDRDKWRYWTSNPDRATADGGVMYVDLEERAAGGLWLDSWDTSFKGTVTSDYTVGQRWVRLGADRLLVAQQRDRVPFTRALEMMRRWGDGVGPHGAYVHRRLVEESANGPAIMDAMQHEISGLKPVRATRGKEARARAITPEIESGNVYLPHPADTGNGWVPELLSELSNFPNDVHDDQVDALTQALANLRTPRRAGVTVPAGRISQRAIQQPSRVRGGAPLRVAR